MAKNKKPKLTSEQRYMARQLVDTVAEFAIVGMGVAAMDELGLRGEELRNFYNKFLLQFDCIIAGTVKIEELKAMLEEETGVALSSIRHEGVAK